MKLPVRILLGLLCAAMVLAMPFVLPSGAMLGSVQWELMEEDESGFAILLPAAFAEEEEASLDIPQTTEEETADAVLPDAQYALPVDFSAGMALNPAGYTEDGYQDDSITVKLETVEQDGVKWRVAYVQIKHPSQLRTATAGKLTSSKVALPSSMAKAKNAVIAINGDYFSNDPNKTTFEYRQGEKIRSKTNKLKDVLVIDVNGDFHTFIKFPEETRDALLDSDIEIVNAYTFGPVLVQKGEKVELDPEYGYNPDGKEPRTAIGQLGTLSYVLVIAEGRTEESAGVTQQELADFMYDLGCIEAFNLDGGNSATMVFNGTLYMDKAMSQERTQSDIIYFASAVDPAAWQDGE